MVWEWPKMGGDTLHPPLLPIFLYIAIFHHSPPPSVYSGLEYSWCSIIPGAEGKGEVWDAAIKFTERKNAQKFAANFEWKYLKVAYIKSRESLKTKLSQTVMSRKSREVSCGNFFPWLFLPATFSSFKVNKCLSTSQRICQNEKAKKSFWDSLWVEINIILDIKANDPSGEGKSITSVCT